MKSKRTTRIDRDNNSPTRFLPQAVLAACLLGTISWVAPVQAEVKTSHVIGQEHPGKYKHPAAIEELDNGDLYIAYYGGDGEYADNTAVYGMRKARGKDSWTKPEVIANTPFRTDGNPVIWQAPDGVTWLFYVCRYGATWSESRIKAKVSHDKAKTWSDSFLIAFQQGMMVRNRPVVLENGDYLLPIYHETGSDRELIGDDSSSLFLRFQPNAKPQTTTQRWTETGRIYSRLGNIQPAVVQLSKRHLVAYCRRGGGYEPRTDGYLVRAESHDGGDTWTRGVDSRFPNPNAAVDFLKLQSGNLLLVFNDNMNDRTPLTLALSEDQDKSYPRQLVLGKGDNTFAYPYAIQGKDGRIHVVYTTNERTTIMHATLLESDIKAK